MDSWARSDTAFGEKHVQAWTWCGEPIVCVEEPIIGKKDLFRAAGLVNGGSEHAKFARQIMIWVDFVLPRYIWQEVDTYKVATVRNSCSTMHTLGLRPLTPDDFQDGVVLPEVLAHLNELASYIWHSKARSGDVIRDLKQHLPESFLQRATMTFNYQTARAMFLQRKEHRLPEWRYTGGQKSICDWIASLPYAKELILGDHPRYMTSE